MRTIEQSLAPYTTTQTWVWMGQKRDQEWAEQYALEAAVELVWNAIADGAEDPELAQDAAWHEFYKAQKEHMAYAKDECAEFDH